MSILNMCRATVLLTAASLFLLSLTSCGQSTRSAARTESGLPESISGGQSGIALSLDPTEVPIIHLENLTDSLAYRDPGEYVIGINDLLKVSILSRNVDDDDEGDEVIVRQDGKVYLRLLGEVQAAGLTVNELQQSIFDNTRPFVKQPFVQLEVLEYNSQFATVFGEIAGVQSGAGRGRRVALKGPTPLIELFSTMFDQRDGGNREAYSASPSLIADLSNLIVTRRNGARYRINLNTYLFGKSHAANIEIRDGDFIFIPNLQDNRVFVLGEVNSPGPLPIGLGLTTTEAVVRAGGFTNIARRNDIKVIRGGLENPNVMNVAVLDVAKKGRRSRDVPLRNGDIVYIPRSPLGSLNLILQQIVPPLQTYLLIQALVAD